MTDLTTLLLELLKQQLAGSKSVNAPDHLVGKFVICRCHSAGVHAGELIGQEGDVVLLKDAYRLWSWKANKGVALNGVAAYGLAPGSRVDSKVSFIRLTGVIETIVCSQDAAGTIQD